MKKTWLWLSLILNLFLVAIIAVCGFLLTNTKCGSVQQTKGANTPVIADDVKALTPEESAVYKPQPVALEWMTIEEKNSYGINTSTESRIQVLKRDGNGKIEDYKIINSDKDILKEY